MGDPMWFARSEETLAHIRSRTDFEPEFGLILGTGLSGLAEEIEVVHLFDYDELPHFPISTVDSHRGELLLGTLAGRRMVAMAGRFHTYEGYSAAEVAYPIIVLKRLVIKRLFLTNASGSVNPQMHAGDIVLLRDHINLNPDNPLRGPNDARLGLRFPDMKQAYDRAGNREIIARAAALGIALHEGVYLGLPGPNMETPAESRMAHLLGADVIGMSTIHEVIMASYLSLPLIAFSVVTNRCYPADEAGDATLEEVIRVARQGGLTLSALLNDLLPFLKV